MASDVLTEEFEVIKTNDLRFESRVNIILGSRINLPGGTHELVARCCRYYSWTEPHVKKFLRRKLRL